LSPELNRSLGNYFFSATDVGHFLDAHLFGAPLGANMIQTTGIDAFKEFDRAAVIVVGIPLMIIAGIATHFNSRASVARQSPEAAANPQTAMMNKLALYVFPIGVVVGGPFLPLAILFYWVSNNIWTYGQQHYVFGKIEKREEEKKAEELERRAANAPAPGAKPKPKRNKPASAPKPPVQDEIVAADEDIASTADEAPPIEDANDAPSTNGAKNGSARSGAPNRTPRRTNNRPKKRRP
jgi:YidC/Oxa1 family membrane protein insertase